ncbi:MAG TPA: TIGR03086 family metal-binding protein [Chloroflexota bacterium]|nr:TIGR03086 family metal-binding protein [Chloroflexota bacterium]
MNGNPIDALNAALDETVRLVDGIQPGQWDNPTPCTDWTVRDLVQHMTRGNRRTIAAGGGPVADDGEEAGAESYRRSADDLKRFFSDPAVMQRTFSMPFGQLPGPAMVAMRVTESTTHDWDLARATAQEPRFPPEAVQMALHSAERMGENARVPGGPFQPPTEAGENASDIERLAALMGRVIA